MDDAGNTVRLLGVNRPGAEYACIEGWGIFDGPTDTDRAVAAITSWKTTAVRLPLNEDCWLGINGVPPKYGGANYRNAIVDYVNRLNAHGQVVIINLHFNAPGTRKATGQQPMADQDHADDFWSSVANVFKDNHSVLFDLYNEPYPDHNRDSASAWSCVLNGGKCRGVSFTAAGMQEMTDAVRATGATQPLMIGGPQYAGVVDRWLEYEPNDPLDQLVASIHIYGPDWAPCWQRACWNSDMAPLAEQVPLVVGEMGDIDCTDNEIGPLMNWSDAHGVSYLAWGWIVSDCKAEPALITSYKGTPTAYGKGLRDHLWGLSVAG